MGQVDSQGCFRGSLSWNLTWTTDHSGIREVLLNSHSYQIQAAEDMKYILLGWVKPSTYIYVLSRLGLEGFYHICY